MAVQVKCDNCMYFDPSSSGVSFFASDGVTPISGGWCRRSHVDMAKSPSAWCGEFSPSKKAITAEYGSVITNYNVEWPR